MIGDTKSDMEFARKTGMSGILIKTPHMIPEDMASAEYSINSLDDIVKLLN
jgi:phosphoglycolate phosphatase-like HAD superfamily hydrolase